MLENKDKPIIFEMPACDGCGRGIDGEQYCGDCMANVGHKLAAAEERVRVAEMTNATLQSVHHTAQTALCENQILKSEVAKLRQESAEAFVNKLAQDGYVNAADEGFDSGNSLRDLLGTWSAALAAKGE